MATRALICFAKREDGVSFSEHPQKVTHQIYHHYDGSPDFLGVKLAEFINDVVENHNGLDCFAAQLLTHLKLGIHYGKCSNDSHNVYLETPGCEHYGLSYRYYLWWGKNEVWISVFNYADDCIFVGKPSNLISKYKLNTNAYG